MPTHLIVINFGVHLLELNADGKGEFLKIEFSTVILAKDIIFNLFLNIPLGTIIFYLIVNQIEDEMYNSIFNLFTKILLQLLNFSKKLLIILMTDYVWDEL